jgi:hypothetical protein
MNKTISPEIKELIEVAHYRPSVSVILPFEPKMIRKEELQHSLKFAASKVAQELLKNYTDELSYLVMQKLDKCIKNLNFNTHKKSVAIFISPVFEKVLYLDVAVEERIMVDGSFEIRDLVYSKKQIHKYLVLLLSGNGSKIYMGNTESFVRIVSSSPESIRAYVNDVPERVANFSDMSERKENVMEKFLFHIDNTLDMILNAYRLPLFVLGTERIIGHFKAISKHSAVVIDYVHGNYEETTLEELKEKLSPYIADWKKVKEKDLLKQLEEAAGKKKLAMGMKDVWREAMNNKGRLLVVEKNYMYAAEHSSTDDVIYKATKNYNKYSYVKDAVDDAIEKVLENGGDVEFTNENVLTEYHHIALIQYY